MSPRAATLVAILLVSTAVLASDPQSTTTTTTTTSSKAAILATFCNQEYALCIKAPCGPIVTRKPDGTFSIE